MSHDRESSDLPTIEKILADPAASFWLKTALRSAPWRDPIDAANDGDVLARLFVSRCRSLLEDAK